jgi:hypothetical protein
LQKLTFFLASALLSGAAISAHVALGQTCIINTAVVDSPAYETAKDACTARRLPAITQHVQRVSELQERSLLSSQLMTFTAGCTTMARGDDGFQQFSSPGFSFDLVARLAMISL